MKTKYLLFAAILIINAVSPGLSTYAAGCPDIKFLFARGSGAERFANNDYQTFKNTLTDKLTKTSLSYEFEDIDYPAVSVGFDNILNLVGAVISGGNSFSFGKSVKAGSSEIVSIINSSCPNTKYVLGGYSQGAMAVLNALSSINPSKIIFAATFGDPKIYLPEGAGPVPAACSGQNLSSYRIYVPDCRAYIGMLGAKNPYIEANYTGKVGTWCNSHDIMCSSNFSISSHTSYEKDGLYEDASRYIFNKIIEEFHLENTYVSPHDTVIMIDSTRSMENLIADYKKEAIRLAEKTLNAGGRVALYDYRDLADGYTPVKRCDFTTCNLTTFKRVLSEITTDGGGDRPESLLASSFQILQELNWNFGSTKSLVILTDSTFHSPDLDGTTLYNVAKLSKQIDPVNFYIITKESNKEFYEELASATDGKVVSTVDDLSELTDSIIRRFDSLPRVEEEFEDSPGELPEVTTAKAIQASNTSVEVTFETTGEKVIIILNDSILGVTDSNKFTITDIDLLQENQISLVPLSNTRRGLPVNLAIETREEPLVIILKAPNTGQK